MTWKDIKGFPGYQVSDTGLVRTHNKISHTERHGNRHWQDRILKPKKSYHSKRNQERVDLWKDGKPYGFIVARLVAFTFLDENVFDRGLTVNHIDGNWHNNDISNLELISLRANIQHAHANGLYDSRYVPVKITNKLTGEIRTCKSQTEAGELMGKSKGYLCMCKNHSRTENSEFSWEWI